MRRALFFTAASLGLASLCAAAGGGIRDYDFKKRLLADPAFSDCPERVKSLCAGRADTDYCPAGLSLSVSYADVTGDGAEEALIVGSSCDTGTAGPDIHSVYALRPGGGVEELKVPDAEPRVYESLFGNRNYRFAAENGALVAVFTDTSDRETPLKIRYTWDGHAFRVAAVEAPGTYPTSYNCVKAREEQERAICHVQALAALDVRLGQAYRAAKEKRTPQERKALAAEQNRWIEKRNKDCAIYKWWIDCLTKTYQERIAQLEDSPPAPGAR